MSGIQLSAACASLNDCPIQVFVWGSVEANSSSTFSLAQGTLISDDLGRLWHIEHDFTIVCAASILPPVPFELNETGIVFQNAYETMRPRGLLEPCPLGAHCCHDALGVEQVRMLARNASVFKVESISTPLLLPTLNVSATLLDGQGIPVSDQSAGLLQFSFRSVAKVLDPGPNVYRTCNSSAPEQCFLVPSSTFGTGPNSFGFTDASYLALPPTTVCFSPLGFHTRIRGSVWNQLAGFTESRQTWFEVLHGAATAYWSATLSPSFVAPLFDVVRVSSAGFIRRRDTALGSVYLRVHNTAKRAGRFSLWVHSCSDPHVVLPPRATPTLIDMQPQGSAHVHLTMFHAKASLNTTQLKCVIFVDAWGVRQTSVTVMGHVPTNTTLRSTTTGSCSIDQGAPPDCAPVDCFLKYVGTRNWYNATSGLCVAQTACLNRDDLYDPAWNTCRTPQELAAEQVSPSPEFALKDPQDFSLVSPGGNSSSGMQSAIQCVHGSIAANGTSCVCDSGWATNPNQPAYDFVYCDLPSNSTGSTGFQPVGTSQAGPMGPIIIIIFVVIILVLGCCIFCCVRKAIQRNRLLKVQQVQQTHSYSSMLQAMSLMNATVPSTEARLPEHSFNFVLVQSASVAAASPNGPIGTIPQEENPLPLGLLQLVNLN